MSAADPFVVPEVAEVAGECEAWRSRPGALDSADASLRWTRGWRAAAMAGISAILAVAVIGLMAWGYVASAVSITVSVDGVSHSLITHQHSVAELIGELGLDLRPEDRLAPDPDTPLQSGMTITVDRARPVWVQDDGAMRAVWTQANTVEQVLVEAGVTLGPHDTVAVEGKPATGASALPPPALRSKRALPGLPAVFPWQMTQPVPLDVHVQRRIPLRLRDQATAATTVWTSATTVGEALDQVGLVIFEGDLVEPGLGTPLTAGQQVTIERSKPVSVGSRGRKLQTRTRQQTVAALLAEQGLILTGMDRVRPALDAPVVDGMAVRITRVQRAYEVEEEITPYATAWEPDPELEIDSRRLDQEGANGITRHRFQVVLEDSRPISRTLEDSWLAQEPITRVHKYGTKIVLHQLDTVQGPLTYWRKVRMFATSYSADEAGTPRDAPWYGRTRTGRRIEYGIAAVDPAVVRLGSKVFVPGYGLADAADTGGAVKGRWIDVAYDEGQLVPWSRCVDVYLLTPAPPDYLIQYMLPNWPQAACLDRQ